MEEVEEEEEEEEGEVGRRGGTWLGGEVIQEEDKLAGDGRCGLRLCVMRLLWEAKAREDRSASAIVR